MKTRLTFPVAMAIAFTSCPAFAQTAPASSSTKSSDEVVALSPFAVVASPTDSYLALNTHSVTCFSTELSNLPVSADVFTAALIDDIAAVSLEEMIVNYGTGTGIGGANPEGTADATQPGDRASNVNSKIRGLDAGPMRSIPPALAASTTRSQPSVSMSSADRSRSSTAAWVAAA